MKLNKETLKTLIKESLEEMSHGGQEPEMVTHVSQEMIENAILHGEDYLVSADFAAQILQQHSTPVDEAFAELGDKPAYTVSELFGWLGY